MMSSIITALLVLVLVLALLVLLSAAVLLTPFVLPLFGRGAPFVPTGRKTAQLMLDLGKVGNGVKLIDIGSGDGRIVIAAAQRGALAHGIEINPWLVWYARWRARWLGVHKNATFSVGNLWSCDLSSYQVVTVYGLGTIMVRLGKKIKKTIKNR